MKIKGFTAVPRPASSDDDSTTFAQVLRETLANGQAVSVPVNGEPYSVVRNRLSGSAGVAAQRVQARVRTQPNADRTAVLVWLEPKSQPAKTDGAA